MAWQRGPWQRINAVVQRALADVTLADLARSSGAPDTLPPANPGFGLPGVARLALRPRRQVRHQHHSVVRGAAQPDHPRSSMEERISDQSGPVNTGPQWCYLDIFINENGKLNEYEFG